MGRPSDYSDELAARICAELVEGHSLRSICRRDDFPAISSVMKWLANNSTFAEQYARAKEEQADTLADEIVEIADEAIYENVEVDGVLLGVRFDSTAVARNRLRVDARKWAASKLKPKKYGERQQMEHSGPDGGPIETVTRIELVPGDGNGAG